MRHASATDAPCHPHVLCLVSTLATGAVAALWARGACLLVVTSS
jgi:hypothetical protein